MDEGRTKDIWSRLALKKLGLVFGLPPHHNSEFDPPRFAANNFLKAGNFAWSSHMIR